MQLKVNILQMCFTKCAHFTKAGYYTLDKSKFIHVYIAGHPLLLIVLCHLQQFYSKVPILISYVLILFFLLYLWARCKEWNCKKWSVYNFKSSYQIYYTICYNNSDIYQQFMRYSFPYISGRRLFPSY